MHSCCNHINFSSLLSTFHRGQSSPPVLSWRQLFWHCISMDNPYRSCFTTTTLPKSSSGWPLFFHVINSYFLFEKSDSLEIHPKSAMAHLHYLHTSKDFCLLQDLCRHSATWLLNPKHLLQTTTQCQHWIKSKISPADSEVRLPGTAEGKIFSIYLSWSLANILVSQSKIASILLFIWNTLSVPTELFFLVQHVPSLLHWKWSTLDIWQINCLSTFPASDCWFGEHLVWNQMEELQVIEKYNVQKYCM